MQACTAASPSATAICGLPPLRRLAALLGLEVIGDRRLDELRERGSVERVALLDVDRAADVAFEARRKETGWRRQRRAVRERQLHRALVGLARADDAGVRPAANVPLPLFDDL